MSYIIKTKIFEGTLSVLHEMIEKRNLSISELSLTLITDDFINFVKSISKEEKQEIASFINAASLLIYLKSKSLLPNEIFEEEGRSISLLESQLKAHALMKDIVKDIKNIWAKKISKQAKIKYKPQIENVFVPDRQMNIENTYKYIQMRIDELKPQIENRVNIKVDKKIKIEDALSHVRAIIKKLKNINFQNIYNVENIGDERLKEKTKKTVMILFLSLLELIKLGEINVIQENTFGDIIIEENTKENIDIEIYDISQ